MKVSELVQELGRLDPEMQVVLRLAEPEDGPGLELDDVIGGYAQLADERSVSVEFGRAVLVGDLVVE